MQKMKFSVKMLKEKLLENKNKHIEEFNRAKIDYRDAIQVSLESNLKKLKKNQLDISKYFSVVFHAPISHENDYQIVLDMLDLCLDEYLELDHNEFRNYIQDNWDWKQNFTTQNSLYASAKAGA